MIYMITMACTASDKRAGRHCEPEEWFSAIHSNDRFFKMRE